jgi:hypothetical protein
MDYHNKYIKYKKKYLQLKSTNNQCGGTNNYICIPNIRGVFSTYSACKDDERSLYVPAPAQVVPQVLVPVHAPVGHHTPPVQVVPQVLVPAHAPVGHHTPPAQVVPQVLVPVHAPIGHHTPPAKTPQIIKPWPHDSHLLFIALPIAQLSNLGKEIERRISNIRKESSFKNYGVNGKSLYTPHISLIQIYIPNKSKLDELLSNKYIFDEIVQIIKNLFIDHFKINEKHSAIQLHSIQGNYTRLGTWIGRVYDNPDFLQVVSKCNNEFGQSIITELLNRINLGAPSYKHTDIPPSQMPNPYEGSIPTFTHYSMDPITSNTSEFAISSWYTTEWKPHISLAVVLKVDEEKFITDFKDQGSKEKGGQPISFINLWNVNTGKSIKIPNKKDIYNLGSLEYIYVSYKTAKIYIKL